MSDLYEKVKDSKNDLMRVDVFIQESGNKYTIHLWDLAKGKTKPSGKILEVKT